MTEQQHIFELIEDYLHDRMPERERIAFEEQIAQDENLASRLSEAKATNDAIHFASLADLKKTIGQDIKNIKYTYGTNWSKTAFITASMVLVSAITVYLITDNQTSEVRKAETVSSIQNNSSDPVTIEKNYDTLSKETGKENKLQPSISNTIDVNANANQPIPADEPMKPDNNVQEKSKVPNNTTPENKIGPIPKDTNDLRSVSPALPNVKKDCNKAFEINVEPACQNTATGSITILTDGSKEFHFKVDNFNASGPKGFFQNLPPGEHEVIVTYNQECSYAKAVTVEEKWCPMNKSFSFNPDYHEKWEIKYEPGASGTFSIYDRSGKEIYKSTFGTGNEYWNGTASQGNAVPIGTYLALIIYSDGRKEKVELTIVR